MSAKEKAQELIDKYLDIDCVTLCNGCSIGIEEAKQCALITVDEIIKQNVNTMTDYGASWTYWEQVKTEIKNL